MRNVNCTAGSGNDNAATVNGSAVNAGQLISVSVQTAFGDSSAQGTLKLQASNDIPPASNMVAIDGFTPTHWVDIPSATANVLAGNTGVVTITRNAYRWIRGVWSNNSQGRQTINTLADGTPVAQIITAICVDDVNKSLAGTYFLLYDAHNAHTYYVWYKVSGTGANPNVPSATGIEVDIVTNDDAVAVSEASAIAIQAIGSGVPFTSIASEGEIVVYNNATGISTAPADGTPPTGFTFDVALPGSNGGGGPILNNKYFFVTASVADGATQYYFWFNTDGGGIDPLLPGKTGVELDISAGASANAVAQAISDALALLPDFTDISNPVFPDHVDYISFSNTGTGPFVAATDFNTGFTFQTIVGGSSTVTFQVTALSM